MSFHLSAENLVLIDGHILQAALRTEDGEMRESQIDLNEFIGNDNGYFQWDGANFGASAQNVSFNIEGGGEVPVLRAELQDEEGNWTGADINLSERISNINGQFVFE
ncbi:Cyanovirin-N [Geopyxis carbonaria]|nr:Cyanovirin-N [Geopyxis carbonaria]